MGQKSKKEERLGQEKLNNQSCLMKIVEYIDAKNITVKFDDEYKTRVKCSWVQFENGSVVNPSIYKDRLGEEKYNNQGDLMKVIEYVDATNIIVEFQDEYRARVKTKYGNFIKGKIRNPYHRSVYGVGIIGNKYPSSINNKHIKEYNVWNNMLKRCFDEKTKEKLPTYKNATCCDEWLYYPNFYEWLHSQENFEKWLNGDKWCLDKDILVKGNKIYSPDTCCLVPHNVNTLFIKHEFQRGDLPIGVCKNGSYIFSWCNNPFTNQQTYLGSHETIEKAFQTHKSYKEKIIKQVAQTEYNQGNIIKRCYDAMMNYEVEIMD